MSRLEDFQPGEMEALSPKTPLEFKEEQEDQQFLSGEDVDTAPSPDMHPHHD